jgi:hypothetical protein
LSQTANHKPKSSNAYIKPIRAQRVQPFATRSSSTAKAELLNALGKSSPKPPLPHYIKGCAMNHITEDQINQLESVSAQLQLILQLAANANQASLTLSANAFISTINNLHGQLERTIKQINGGQQ